MGTELLPMEGQKEDSKELFEKKSVVYYSTLLNAWVQSRRWVDQWFLFLFFFGFFFFFVALLIKGVPEQASGFLALMTFFNFCVGILLGVLGFRQDEILIQSIINKDKDTTAKMSSKLAMFDVFRLLFFVSAWGPLRHGFIHIDDEWRDGRFG